MKTRERPPVSNLRGDGKGMFDDIDGDPDKEDETRQLLGPFDKSKQKRFGDEDESVA